MTSEIDSDVKVPLTVYIFTSSTVLEIRFEPDSVALNTPMGSSVSTFSRLDLSRARTLSSKNTCSFLTQTSHKHAPSMAILHARTVVQLEITDVRLPDQSTRTNAFVSSCTFL